MTVSSFASVSLSPPLVSVCLASDARTLARALASGQFAINVLASNQGRVSDTFAAGNDDDRFDNQAYVEGANGCRLIAGALAQLECGLFAQHQAGDHVLVIGEVQRVVVNEGLPLLYFAGSYGGFEVQQ